MTCRDEVIKAFQNLARLHGRNTFSPSEVVDEMRRYGSLYQESTIRTHIVSRMCGEAPDHHAVVYDDLERVGPGMYKLERP